MTVAAEVTVASVTTVLGFRRPGRFVPFLCLRP
jgi:hypothetical protein